MRCDLAVAQAAHYAGQGPQMRGIIAARAQQQKHKIGTDVVCSAEVLRGPEASEDADGSLNTRDCGVGNGDATAEAKARRLSAFQNRVADNLVVQRCAVRRDAGECVDDMPDVARAQA
jgi:hypothetical protein